jgi:hypothetical protein
MTIAVFVELLFAIAQLIAAASFICDQLPVKKVGVACCHDFVRAYTPRRFGGATLGRTMNGCSLRRGRSSVCGSR